MGDSIENLLYSLPDTPHPMRNMLLPIIFLASFFMQAQRLKVSDNNRYLVTEDGKPFFWMADTAWELFHRTDLQEAKMYLKKRKEQGFNVIQAVALAELDGLNTPNRYGEKSLSNNDPMTPNPRYFEYVDAIIDMADSLDMYIALLPSWGDKVFKNSWGTGPEIFTPDNARAYGQWIGNRYKEHDNIIWIIGGDRNPRAGSTDITVWNQMAEGIAAAAGGYGNTLMGFHPQPNRPGGSSTWFHNEPWLDFNMHQTGHCANQGTYKFILHDYDLIRPNPYWMANPYMKIIPIVSMPRNWVTVFPTTSVASCTGMYLRVLLAKPMVAMTYGKCIPWTGKESTVLCVLGSRPWNFQWPTR